MVYYSYRCITVCNLATKVWEVLNNELSLLISTSDLLRICCVSDYCGIILISFCNWLSDQDEQVLLFCIAIQYRSPGIGIAILQWKMSNTWAIPENCVGAKHVNCLCGFDNSFVVRCLTSHRVVDGQRWIIYLDIFKRRKKKSHPFMETSIQCLG